MKIHFPKIIWGDVTILECDGEIGLIDTGYDTTFESIKEYLSRMGVEEISFILLTHFHRDHYGSIPALLDAFRVKRVYFKEYSGLEKNTAWGTPADDEYRKSELLKCAAMRELIREKSTLISAETTEFIPFGDYRIELYATENRVRAVYEDAECEELYHEIVTGENANSLIAFLKVDGVNILFCGDATDRQSVHPLFDRVNANVARAIGEEIDVYKVPHHGTGGCNSSEALDIYKPKIAVITNRIGYLAEKSPIFADLKRANPDVKIILTELCDAIIGVSKDGRVTVEKSAEFDTDTGVFSKM